ncbi:MAG: hypothetical protein EOR30_09115 [Mesorhizobium sp.]|uniref:hypothetical protein n=1 Tax=unclassified Mesorhizobium TaxID=325217 RepID=UPI000FCCA5A7|nr:MULTISPECIES: hypothetical protein [unclassified Mesorhizobium]RUV74178.1 hypothetical protein EOA78_09570 [Mesorhizobium sp. M5C.F.Cr.IN.023.01.1.1]RWF84436.1 MAG: hypothetical protein EOQ36_25680 [Mesorhizobium sp.]RWF92134.1 MAG: hypothetical protein EOQ45_22510 [Mesorhizobium sp.]RWI43438.1 MAG: hypothetical protein EOR14_02315 [Mesorhizobium sp.]RWI47768.1 MAG: hypothetical protein EOR15_15045 [Mesorhizobium sp.]
MAAAEQAIFELEAKAGFCRLSSFSRSGKVISRIFGRTIQNVTKNQRVCAYCAIRRLVFAKLHRATKRHDLHTNNRQMRAVGVFMN